MRASVLEPVAPVTGKDYDLAIVGSGAGGGTVAQELIPLVRDGRRVLLLEQGARLDDHEFTGREAEMAGANARGCVTLRRIE